MGGRFEGKVALVTGGSSGMGEATALAFAREGANVVIAARRVTEGEGVVRRIKESGGEAMFMKTDIARTADVEALMAKTVATYGRLDVAFNNAATWEMNFTRFKDTTEEQFDRIVGVNIKGTWLCMKNEISQMITQGGGVIINNASIMGLRGTSAGLAIYCATKHAMIGLVKSAALECAKHGIRVNVICPGYIDTPMLGDGSAEGVRNPTVDAQKTKGIPLRRLGTPEDVAQTALWLCSDDASYITGQSIAVDGGITAG